MTPRDTDVPSREHRPGRRTALKALGGLVALGSIGTAVGGSIASASGADDVRSSLTMIAPAAAGGGWDAVARQLQQCQRAHSIANNAQVVNIPGAGGTIALANIAARRGIPHSLMIGGTGLLAATIQFKSDVAFTDAPPLATLVEEYDAIVVPKDSPHKDLDSLLAAWKKAPKKLPWTGGGSFDQLVITDTAITTGIDPAAMTYISGDGGGEAVQSLLNGTAQASACGLPDVLDQVESGRLRALAIVAPKRVAGVDIPTTVELGHDITLSNWRSVSAPPGLRPEDLTALRSIVTESIATPEWDAAVKRYGWTPRVRTGHELDAFIAEQTRTITTLLKEMGK